MNRSLRRRFWSPDFPLIPTRWPIFYGWVVVAVATLGIVFSIPGQTMGFSVFTDILIRELGLNRVQLSTAYCIGTVISGFTLPTLGRVFDQLGARKMVVWSSIATGVILFFLSRIRPLLDGLSSILSSVSETVIAFVLITIGFYLIRASAQGVLTMTCRNVMGKWFDYHRGTALAVSGVATAFCFSIAPRFLDELIRRFDYDGAWILLGSLTLTVMAGLGWLLIRDNPEECGLTMDGPIKPGKKRQPHADSIAHRDYERAETLRTWAFWVFNLSFAFFALFSTAFTFHIVSIGEESGLLRSRIIGFFVPMSVISVITNLAVGWVSSRTRLKYLLLVMNAAAVLGVLGTLWLSSPSGVLAFILGNGICGGAFSALSGIVWPRFFGRKHLGSIQGTATTIMVVGASIGPLPFGAAYDATGSYQTDSGTRQYLYLRVVPRCEREGSRDHDRQPGQ